MKVYHCFLLGKTGTMRPELLSPWLCLQLYSIGLEKLTSFTQAKPHAALVELLSIAVWDKSSGSSAQALV